MKTEIIVGAVLLGGMLLMGCRWMCCKNKCIKDLKEQAESSVKDREQSK